MRRPYPSTALRALSLAALLVASACGDDPAAPETHPDAQQVRLQIANVVLASATTSQAFDAITIVAGNQGQLEVVFVDSLDNPIDTDGLTLQVAVATGTIVSWEPDEPDGFFGTFSGLNPGNTTVVFRLMHDAGGSVHADFVSAPIPFNVTAN